MIIAAYAPFTRLQTVLLEPYSKFLDTAGQSLASGLGPIVLGVSTLYILFNAIRMVRGETDEPVGEFVKMSLKVGAIAALALNFETYRYYVANPLIDGIPNTISQMFVGEQMPTVNQFDSCAASLGIFLAKAWKGVAWYDYSGMFRVGSWSIIITIVGAGVIVSGFLLTMFTKAIMYLILSLGPVFIVCAMFEQTRSYLNHFVSSAVTLIVQQILVAAVMGLILNTLKEAMVFTSAEAFAVDCMNILLLCLFVSYIFYQLPTMAQRLGGNGIAAALPAMLYRSQAGRQSQGGDLPPELRTDGNGAPGRDGGLGGGLRGGGGDHGRAGARTETAAAGSKGVRTYLGTHGQQMDRSGNPAAHSAAFGGAVARSGGAGLGITSVSPNGFASGSGGASFTGPVDDEQGSTAFGAALERGSRWQETPSYEGVSVSQTAMPGLAASSMSSTVSASGSTGSADDHALGRTDTLDHGTEVGDIDHQSPYFSEVSQIAALAEAGRQMRASDTSMGGSPTDQAVPTHPSAMAIPEPTTATVTATIAGTASGI